MDFALNDDQLELKQQARAWLADRFPLDRDWESTEDRWGDLAELGWFDVAEAGLGFVEEALLLEELGYACYPGPYIATVGFALPWLSAEQRARVAAGDERWSVDVNGYVPWLGAVDFVVSDGGTAYPARGEEVASVDPSRPFGRLDKADGKPLAGNRNLPRARTASAAEALGVAQRALDLGVEHAKMRLQFEKAIGTYQAVSHPLAQTYTDVELARSLVYWAAWCVAEADERAPLAAAAAMSFATEAAVAACERSIQVHGGIGFTWEHPLHRFYKRALWLEGFGSRPAELRLEVANALLA
ncbi:MAG TPA: acyl-CoA dehydrogenase family protein [Gaiellaceae bacterium]|nr:acyl-CoA dehydrogenase family protein [Gaiellaceae bacterium]